MNDETRYIRKREKYWYYARTVPVRFIPFDSRVLIRRSLKTKSILMAKERRNAMEAADNDYWASLIDLHSKLSDVSAYGTDLGLG